MIANVFFEVFQHLGVKVEQLVKRILCHRHASDALGHGEQGRGGDQSASLTGHEVFGSAGFYRFFTLLIPFSWLHVEQGSVQMTRLDGGDTVTFCRLGGVSKEMCEVLFEMVDAGLYGGRTDGVNV